MNLDLSPLRKDYQKDSLDISDLDSDPIAQFSEWFSTVQKMSTNEANAMTLATCNKYGQPSARMVLLKSVVNGRFVFFTNYDSRKSEELNENPHAALVFWWPSMERQVRVEGVIEKVSSEDSDEYFNSRPLESKYSALASPQSKVVVNRKVLEDSWATIKSKFPDNESIQRPDNWGGWAVEPTRIEFWQGRASRLHDRFAYQKNKDNSWKIDRLAP